MDNAPKWNGHPIVDADHTHILETQSSINELMHKMPRHEAEKAAHDFYKKDQLAEAAAHHLIGMQTAHAAGSKEDAKKHGAMYVLCLKQLGHDAVGAPPHEVATKAKNLKATNPIYNFKAHKGDSFAIPGALAP